MNKYDNKRIEIDHKYCKTAELCFCKIFMELDNNIISCRRKSKTNRKRKAASNTNIRTTLLL